MCPKNWKDNSYGQPDIAITSTVAVPAIHEFAVPPPVSGWGR